MPLEHFASDGFQDKSFNLASNIRWHVLNWIKEVLYVESGLNLNFVYVIFSHSKLAKTVAST